MRLSCLAVISLMHEFHLKIVKLKVDADRVQNMHSGGTSS